MKDIKSSAFNVVIILKQLVLTIYNYSVLYFLGRESFEEAIKKLSFERKKHPKVPIMLVANKMDLQTERYYSSNAVYYIVI